jgi:hypothetical protein
MLKHVYTVVSSIPQTPSIGGEVGYILVQWMVIMANVDVDERYAARRKFPNALKGRFQSLDRSLNLGQAFLDSSGLPLAVVINHIKKVPILGKFVCSKFPRYIGLLVLVVTKHRYNHNKRLRN